MLALLSMFASVLVCLTFYVQQKKRVVVLRLNTEMRDDVFRTFYGKKHAHAKWMDSVRKAAAKMPTYFKNVSVVVGKDTITFAFSRYYAETKTPAETDKMFVLTTHQLTKFVDVSHLADMFNVEVIKCSGLHVLGEQLFIHGNLPRGKYLAPYFAEQLMKGQRRLFLRELNELNEKIEKIKGRWKEANDERNRLLMEFFGITSIYKLHKLIDVGKLPIQGGGITPKEAEAGFRYLTRIETHTIIREFGPLVVAVSNRPLWSNLIGPAVRFEPFIVEPSVRYNRLTEELNAFYGLGSSPFYLSRNGYPVYPHGYLLEKYSRKSIKSCTVCTRQCVISAVRLDRNVVLCVQCFMDTMRSQFIAVLRDGELPYERFIAERRFKSVFAGDNDWLRISAIGGPNANVVFFKRRLVLNLMQGIFAHCFKAFKVEFVNFLQSLRMTTKQLIERRPLPADDAVELPAGLARCPTCAVIVEKSDGCDAITCARCSTLFCYQCSSLVDVPFENGFTCHCEYDVERRIYPITRTFQHHESLSAAVDELQAYANIIKFSRKHGLSPRTLLN